MPVLKIKLPADTDQSAIDALTDPLTAAMAEYTGKPSSLVTLLFEPLQMFMGGDDSPSCLIEAKVPPGVSGDTDRDGQFFEEISQIISEQADIPKSRIAVDVDELNRFGMNGAVLI